MLNDTVLDPISVLGPYLRELYKGYLTAEIYDKITRFHKQASNRPKNRKLDDEFYRVKLAACIAEKYIQQKIEGKKPKVKNKRKK